MVETISASRNDDKIRSLNAAAQAAVGTFHRNLDGFVDKQRAIQQLTDARLSAIETTQSAILDSLNALPNQIAAVFTALYAANPPGAPPRHQNAVVPPVEPPPAEQDAPPIIRDPPIIPADPADPLMPPLAEDQDGEGVSGWLLFHFLSSFFSSHPFLSNTFHRMSQSLKRVLLWLSLPLRLLQHRWSRQWPNWSFRCQGQRSDMCPCLDRHLMLLLRMARRWLRSQLGHPRHATCAS